ncbi:hypothetical protein HYB67_004246 [Salmonella enterica subsp. enterica serovar Sandiego]|nr:hypothetical protein [Salmonella enterica subsp. enterica serovar Sandiego]EFS0316810.1 hypothetical protein [Salmonella enterica subsp. enterica serovar Sandiego]
MSKPLIFLLALLTAGLAQATEHTENRQFIHEQLQLDRQRFNSLQTPEFLKPVRPVAPQDRSFLDAQAQQFRQSMQPGERPVEAALVFVSFSMPPDELKQRVQDAAALNIPVVIRGMVNGDTNYSHREGHMTSQLDSGATKTLTSSGQSVYNTTEAISKLPVDIALGKTASSSWQQQQRDAMSEAQSLSNSLSQTSSLATSQMSQWSQQRGNSDASTGSNLTKALNTIQSIGSRYARDENTTLAEGIRAAATKSQDMSFGAGASVQGSVDSDRQILGKVAGLVTGGKVSGEAHLKGEYTGRSGSSHGTSSDLTQQGGTSKGFSAQELKDFRDAMDVVASSRVTDSGSHTDNASASLANQLSSTFSSLKSQASQYNDAVTRSHEYSQLASYAENNSASINQNYSQEFVGYVTSQRPGEADQLLSDAASPEVRAERDRLAQAFVEDRMKPQLLQEFEQNRGRTGEGMGSVGASSGGGNLQSEYDTQQAQMENRANAGGVRLQDDVSSDVADRRRHAESQVNSEKNTVISSGNTPKEEYNRLQSEHEQGNKNFSDAKSAEEKRQSDKIGDNSIGRNNLNRIKDELQDKFNKE